MGWLEHCSEDFRRTQQDARNARDAAENAEWESYQARKEARDRAIDPRGWMSREDLAVRRAEIELEGERCHTCKKYCCCCKEKDDNAHSSTVVVRNAGEYIPYPNPLKPSKANELWALIPVVFIIFCVICFVCSK